MVRHFKPDPIPREKLERIAAAAQRAPSAGFSQGQRIVVVTERAQMKRVADIAGEPIYVSQGDHPWLSTCGAQIVPCVSERLYHERYQRPDKLEPGASRRNGRSGLGIPDDFIPVGVIPVGWPLEDPPSPSLRRERLLARELAWWERW